MMMMISRRCWQRKKCSDRSMEVYLANLPKKNTKDLSIPQYRGIYSGQPEKIPPSKLFPVFVDYFCGHLSFFRSFKLHKGILTCVLSLFSFFFFSLTFFMKSSFKFFPVFQFGQKNGQNI